MSNAIIVACNLLSIHHKFYHQKHSDNLQTKKKRDRKRQEEKERERNKEGVGGRKEKGKKESEVSIHQGGRPPANKRGETDPRVPTPIITHF